VSTIIKYLKNILLIFANVAIYEIAQQELDSVLHQAGVVGGTADLMSDIAAMLALAGFWAVVLFLGYREDPAKPHLLKVGILAILVLFGSFVVIRLLDALNIGCAVFIGFGLMFVAFYRLSKMLDVSVN